MRVGGNELYLANLANKLNRLGHEIIIVYLGSLDMDKVGTRFDSSIKILHGSNYLPKFLRKFARYIVKIHQQLFLLYYTFINLSDLKDCDAVHTFDCESFDLALTNFDNKKITTGVYHSREFFWESNTKYRNQQLQSYRDFPLENVFATRKSILLSLQGTFQGSLRNDSIFELSVDYIKVSLPKKRQIVIAARLVNFKTYIEHVLNFWAFNKPKGYKLIIIGDGPLKEKLKKNFVDCNGINFIDEVHYDELCKILSESEIFIGSGTTLILSALYGCIPVIGIENDSRGLTPGTLAECNELSFFLNDNNEYFQLNSYLIKLIDLSDQDKKIIQDHNSSLCERYDPDVNAMKFLNFISGSKEVSIRKCLSFISVLVMLALDFSGFNNDFRKRYDN